MTVGKTAKISSPSMKRRKSVLGEGDMERETKALASFYPSPPPVDFVQSTVSQFTICMLLCIQNKKTLSVM